MLRGGRDLQRQAAYLRVVHTQGLDLVKWKQDTDEKHLVLFLKGQGKAIDDARSQGTFLGPKAYVQAQCTHPPIFHDICIPHSPAKDLQELGNPIVMFSLINEPKGRRPS